MNKIYLVFIILFLAGCSASAGPAVKTATQEPATLQPELPTAAPSATQTLTAAPTESPFVPPEFTPFPRLGPEVLVIDGMFADWDLLEPIYVDPAGDAGPSGVDFTDVYAVHTDSHLIMKVSLGREVNLQSEPALHLSLVFGDSEISYDFGSRRGRINGVLADQSEIGVITLPTVTSDQFEITLPIETFEGEELGILFSDPFDRGDIASTGDMHLKYTWDNYVGTTIERSLDRPENTLRILSWNVLRDNIFKAQFESQFARVLQALQPDVILIQEIYTYSDMTALSHISEWLGGEWYARKQGDLITVSRYPFIEGWRESNYNLRARIFPAMLDINGRPLVVFNAHLSCCDKDRDRQDEVDSMIGFLRQVGLPAGTPFFLAGDLNLVGNARQLTTLLTGDIIGEERFGQDYFPDWDGTPLADLVPGHTHSNFTTTWRDDNTSFAPGRLDFFIYTDSVINARGFVLDTSELPEAVLEQYGLAVEDTEVSDHLPLVVDITIVAAP